MFCRYHVDLSVFTKGFKRENSNYFSTATNLIDTPLMNLCNFHVDEANNVTTIYWFGRDEISITKLDKIEIQYENAQGIAM